MFVRLASSNVHKKCAYTRFTVPYDIRAPQLHTHQTHSHGHAHSHTLLHGRHRTRSAWRGDGRAATVEEPVVGEPYVLL